MAEKKDYSASTKLTAAGSYAISSIAIIVFNKGEF
jgi:hypothetical protein